MHGRARSRALVPGRSGPCETSRRPLGAADAVRGDSGRGSGRGCAVRPVPGAESADQSIGRWRSREGTALSRGTCARVQRRAAGASEAAPGKAGSGLECVGRRAAATSGR